MDLVVQEFNINNKLNIDIMKGSMGIKLRRNSAKAMLEAQLKSGKKPEKIDGKTTKNMVNLTDGDKARINREIDAINNPNKKGRTKVSAE